MEKESIEQFKEDVQKKYLVINRIPSKTRDEFIEFSKEEFCGDYGMTLKVIFDQFKEYQYMKAQLLSNVDIKLNHIIDLVDKGKKDSGKAIRNLSGDIIGHKKEDENEN